MLVLVILVASIFVFRGLGFAGVSTLASWPAAARDGLAVMLLFTASAHFTSMKEDLVRMTPAWIPRPRVMVFFTGLCEIAGVIGLVIPTTRRAAAIGLILFFIAVLPANIHAARAGVTLRGRPATPLWLRLPMQLLFIVLAWWSTRYSSCLCARVVQLRYNALMKRLVIALSLLFSASLAAQAPVAVPVGKEPYHHLVFENEYVRVFRVSVPPHDATLLHQHDLPYVYVSLGPADFINAVAGKPEARVVMTDGQVGYSRGGFAHVARTDVGTPFDNVTIELLHPQGEPRNLCAQILPGAASGGCDKASGSADRGRDFSVESQLETQEMSLDLVRFGPETISPKLALQSNSLLVCLNGAEVRIDVDGKPAKTLQGGEVLWIDGGTHGFASNPSKKLSSGIQLSFKDNGGGAKP